MRDAAERIARGVKVCSKCGRERPLAVYRADPRTRDGHRPECGDCQRAAARDAYYRRADGVAADLRSTTEVEQHVDA
jgi:ribosomal protein L37AE/L43A